jgi:hypothetical protein
METMVWSGQQERKPVQRVYHFISACYGLDDLRNRHLKIAQIDELNDPFELWTFAQPDHFSRQVSIAFKEEMALRHGLLCFSLDWHNPLLWSHYADKHRGIALGFDVDEEMLWPVSYVKSRLNPERLYTEVAQENMNIEVDYRLLFSKYIDWQYESETRVYTTLKDRNPDGFYFYDFSEQIVLREVIAGPHCMCTERELRAATGPTTVVKFAKARLAFNSFRVVTDSDDESAVAAD